MRTFDELLKESASIHGHLCAGQVLGVRMAMVGCREVGIDEPKGSKKLLVYVEIDRCATDAIQAVTGCSLGKRSLKFLDYGKMAATFLNLESRRAVRVLALDEARSLIGAYAGENTEPRDAAKRAYAVMPEESLFRTQAVTVPVAEEDLPGARGNRVVCARCGEGINFRREVRRNGRVLCIPCAEGSDPFRYGNGNRRGPAAVLAVIGPSGSGKTTVIERLIPELSARGYRIGTVKHHHGATPVAIDCNGKDSWRHRRAGAGAVALVSPSEFALFQDLNGKERLQAVIELFDGFDLVLVEGFHSEPAPRIEIRSGLEKPAPLSAQESPLIAVIGNESSGHAHSPYVSSQHLKNLGRREGGGCKAERGIAPERTSAVREDASPKRQRSRRPLSTDQGQSDRATRMTPIMERSMRSTRLKVSWLTRSCVFKPA